MIRKVLFCYLVSSITMAAQNAALKGSISGSVLEAGSGSPIAAADVYVSPGGKSAQTDAKGNYEVRDLAAGAYKLSVYSDRGQGPHGTKSVRLTEGQDLTVDFRLTPKASISGRVLDENGEAVPGVRVALVAREYRLGTMRHVYARISETDDRGQYELKGIEPGLSYLVEAKKETLKLSSISDAPIDPALRKKTTQPTWYPDSDSLDAAQVLVLQPGEHREGMDIRLKRSVSYCLDGVLGANHGPAPLNFSIAELEPTYGFSGDQGLFAVSPYGAAGPDGRIRLCNLHTGVYRITAYDGANAGPTFFGEMEVPVGDKDVHGVKVFGRGHISIAGELVWDGKPPDQLIAAKIHIMIEPMTRAPFSGELSQLFNLPPLPVPGQFTLPSMLVDDYSVNVTGVPSGVYVKDIVYGGQSALHKPMQVGKTMGSDLRIVFAHDGGVISVTVADKDNNSVPDCKVLLLPETAATEAEVADWMLQGQTDQYGQYKSSSIAPGKYYLLATNSSVDRTPETLTKLLRSRTRAQEAELQPSGSLQMTLQPMDLN